MNSSITFVSSFFYIYDKDYDEQKSINWRIERFREIAETGIKICIYTCPTFEKYIKDLETEFPENVKWMKTMNIDATIIGKYLKKQSYFYLPAQRNETKDINDYLIIINSKTEFMADTIERNPWNSTHFAWMDFNISHVFFEKDKSLMMLRSLSKRTFKKSCFVIPGCWEKFNNEYIVHVSETIFWRFCGGFFLGDAESILEFHKLYTFYFPKFIQKYQKLIWEVNFWAWLEVNSDWEPQWYKGDHNDTILLVPPENFSQILMENGGNQSRYDYVDIPGYTPSSASNVYYKGQYFLNTRYVNYLYYPDGSYMFPDGTNVIRSKNILSELFLEENSSGENILVPDNYIEMNESITLPESNFYARNIEDIRLYVINDTIKFIGTTVGYHTTGGNRMIIGKYDINACEYFDGYIVEPPTNTWCEKNWIPLINKEGDEHFIYRWEPLEIGKVVYDTETNIHQLQIVTTFHETKYVPFFHKMRGSTPFISTANGLVGVVHFSEDTKPRHYFHMLVLLDKNNFQPLKYSEPFVFEQVAIEFCIGFDIRNDKYCFWISRFDSSPLLVYIDIDKIPFANIF